MPLDRNPDDIASATEWLERNFGQEIKEKFETLLLTTTADVDTLISEAIGEEKTADDFPHQAYDNTPVLPYLRNKCCQ